MSRMRVKPVSSRARAERSTIDRVKREVDQRDAWCRLEPLDARQMALVGPCSRGMTWAHLHSHMRSKTRRMEPTARHALAVTFKACTKHHDAYDRHEFDLVVGEHGADGLMVAVPHVKRGAA